MQIQEVRTLHMSYESYELIIILFHIISSWGEGYREQGPPTSEKSVTECRYLHISNPFYSPLDDILT